MMDIPKQVKAWMPLLIGVIATAAGLILPLALATAYPETWGAAGWVLYFYIVPVCAVILLISAVISLTLSLKAHGDKQSTKAPEIPRKSNWRHFGKAVLILICVLAALWVLGSIFL